MRVKTKTGCRFRIKKLTLKKEDWLYVRSKTLAPVLTPEEYEVLMKGDPENDSERMQILRKEFLKGYCPPLYVPCFD